jgi:hypothetical protein
MLEYVVTQKPMAPAFAVNSAMGIPGLTSLGRRASASAYLKLVMLGVHAEVLMQVNQS